MVRPHREELGALGGTADYSDPALSPDGNRLAIGIRDPETGKCDRWILDLGTGAALRFTFDPGDDFDPAWAPDRTRVAFTSGHLGTHDLYVKDANASGQDELLLSSKVSKNLEDWAPDGRWIVFNASGAGNEAALAVLSMETRKTQDSQPTPFAEHQSRV